MNASRSIIDMNNNEENSFEKSSNNSSFNETE